MRPPQLQGILDDMTSVAGEIRYPRVGGTIGDGCDGAKRKVREATSWGDPMVGLGCWKDPGV